MGVSEREQLVCKENSRNECSGGGTMRGGDWQKVEANCKGSSMPS